MDGVGFVLSPQRAVSRWVAYPARFHMLPTVIENMMLEEKDHAITRDFGAAKRFMGGFSHGETEKLGRHA